MLSRAADCSAASSRNAIHCVQIKGLSGLDSVVRWFRCDGSTGSQLRLRAVEFARTYFHFQQELQLLSLFRRSNPLRSTSQREGQDRWQKAVGGPCWIALLSVCTACFLKVKGGNRRRKPVSFLALHFVPFTGPDLVAVLIRETLGRERSRLASS